MGHRLARDEANSEHVPTWLAEQVLEQGYWMVNEATTPTTPRERILLANLVAARKQAEAARVQLDAIEGIGHG